MERVETSDFSYHAQTPEGLTLAGTVEATSPDDARRRLQALGLRLIELGETKAPRTKPLRGADFVAFNQQLAQLTAAGMPIEHGLRLIAHDMRRGRLRRTIEVVAAELEKGRPLAEAFAAHRAQFPPLYGRLLDAGVRANNLPGMLLNLGRHLELVQRLRATLWNVGAYPAMVGVVLLLILLFMGAYILPQFRAIFDDFETEPPALTKLVLGFGEILPGVIVALLVLTAIAALAWFALQRSGKDRAVIEALILPLPLLGPVLRRNLLARWCDALRLGVEAGLDLPAAIPLANEAVGWPGLSKEGLVLAARIESGQPLATDTPGYYIPPSVRASINFAAQGRDLPGNLKSLSDMYAEQAELRLALLQTFLPPLLLIVVASVIGLIIAALFLPLVKLIQGLT